MNQQQIEAALASYLGTDQVLWIENSKLEGDDTDGHIDMLARFVKPDTIVYTACENETDANYASLAALQLELRSLRDRNGKPYNLVPLVMPEPIFNNEGKQLPASYANFLIVNNAVLVPTYGVDADERALATLQTCFNQHEVLAVPARALIEQFGSLHCATMQLPQ